MEKWIWLLIFVAGCTNETYYSTTVETVPVEAGINDAAAEAAHDAHDIMMVQEDAGCSERCCAIYTPSQCPSGCSWINGRCASPPEAGSD